MLYDETYWYVGAGFARAVRVGDPPHSDAVGDRHDRRDGVQRAGVQGGDPEHQRPGVGGDPGRGHDRVPGLEPDDPKCGVSPVHALKAILAEQIHAQVFRDQMWKRGGRVGTTCTGRAARLGRRVDRAARSFIKQWQRKYSGDNGAKAGGTPLLEDGMELKSNRFSAKDEQFVEASKLSLETCAQVYFINPTMVGILDNANYSNVREFRKMLYGDNLGPEIERMQQRINRKLVPRLADPRTVREFNLQTKLAGSFEEQGDLLQRRSAART
jgi:HK97 family phage portal protein